MDQISIDKTNNVILYDGICNLCNGTMTFLRKIDSKKMLKMIPLQSAEGKVLLESFSLSSFALSSVVFIHGDALYLKSSAVLHIMKELKNGWSVMYVLIYIPRPLRDFFYGLIAKYRYKLFGTSPTCSVVPQEY